MSSKRRCHYVYLLVACLCSVTVVNAQVSGLRLCNQDINIGDSGERVLKALLSSGGCGLQRVKELEPSKTEMYIVSAAQDQSLLLGQIGLQSGKVDLLVRRWAQQATDKISFGKVLIDLLHQFDSDGHNHCTLMTTTSSKPENEYRNAEFRCGSRKLELEYHDFQSNQAVEVSEIITQ